MIKDFKLEKKPIGQTTTDEARIEHQEGFCIWCDAAMHSQRTASGEWAMYCYKGQQHTHPFCINMYNNRKTVLEWRHEDWEAIFASMDHEDPLREEVVPPVIVPPNNVDNPNGIPGADGPGDEEPGDEEPGAEDIDINNVVPGSGEQPGNGKEPIKIIHRPPRKMLEVVRCGVLFLMNLGAIIANGTRIGDRITSYIDRKWIFIAIFASLLHIPSGFLSVPSSNAYHAFQFVPTCITRSTVEGALAFYFMNTQIYINLKLCIDPMLPKKLKKQLGNVFVKLRKKSLEENPKPKNDYDHFLATELLVASGKWHMVETPHKAGKYLRVAFETTIRSQDQIALCKDAMKWLKSQGEKFNGLNIK